jgi:hypothetical protein
MVKYAIIGVEGPHDQAFVGKVLQLLGFKKFRGEESKLDDFWDKFKPNYPKKGNLYKRLDMPSILFTDSISVAVYAGEGSSLPVNLEDVIIANSKYRTGIAAFGIVADADDKAVNSVVQRYYDRFRNYFPNFPKSPGVVDKNTPRTGIYVLPDNASEGVLDTLICQCGEVVYPEYMERAKSYLELFSEEEREGEPLKWKPFDREKALIATVVSILKPGSSNTASIANDDWVSDKSQNEIAALANFVEFLRQLLEDS